MSNSFYLGMQVWCVDVPANAVLRGVVEEVHIPALGAHFLVIQTKDGRRLTCTDSLVFPDDVSAHETLDYMQVLAESAMEHYATKLTLSDSGTDIGVPQTVEMDIRNKLAGCYGFSA